MDGKEMNNYFLLNLCFSVVHATPSALYAHVANRRLECEANLKPADQEHGCKDIGRQLVEDEPGRSINVIMGGGRQCLVSNVTDSKEDPIDRWACYSKDGRDLIRDWSLDKEKRKLKHAVVSNNEELKNLNTKNADYVMGMSQKRFLFISSNFCLQSSK